MIASNNSGVWNEQGDTLEFSVAPAYYQTSWFRALCVAGVMALLWAAYQLRVQHLQHQFDMTLDARVGERTRIARELHDTLLQSAHGLLLRFQIVSQLLPDRPIEAKEKLDNAIDQTANFITEARDEVQGLRDSTVQSNDLALAISTLGKNSQRTQPTTGLPSGSPSRAKRAIYIPSSGTRFIRLPPKRCETRSGTLVHSGLRLKFATTTSNSDYVSGMMETALIGRFFRPKH